MNYLNAFLFGLILWGLIFIGLGATHGPIWLLVLGLWLVNGSWLVGFGVNIYHLWSRRHVRR